jgi:hypothetical protein
MKQYCVYFFATYMTFICFLMQYHEDVNLKKMTYYSTNNNLRRETAVDTPCGF